MNPRRCFAALSILIAPTGLVAQTPPPGVAYAAGFQPGGQALFTLDLSQTPVGDSPSSIEVRRGNVEVVLKGGVRMLKASSATEFVITLPQVLPADFTLEFDLVPKRGSNPQDFSFEGTPVINQGAGSAHVLWHATGYLAVIGGGPDNYETPMPEDLRATLPGVRTLVGVSVSGNTIKLYTNGRRLFTLDRVFARGQVLRVFLGGVDDGTEAVYLAGLRVATGGGLGIIAAQAGLPNRTQFPPGTTPYVPPAPGSGTTSTGSALSGSTLAGSSQSTVTVVGGGSPTVKTVAGAPAPTPVNAPSGPAIASGPLPGGTAMTPAQVAATQQLLSKATQTLPVVGANSNNTTSTSNPLATSRSQPSGVTGTAMAPTGIIAQFAGPANLSTTSLAKVGGFNGGWGILLGWTQVPGATGYRVSRTPAGSAQSAVVTPTVTFPQTGPAMVNAVDPMVLPGASYTYWVEALLSSGPTAPSPVSTVDAGFPSAAIGNLQAVVGGTQSVVLPGSLAIRGPMPGSQVTWTWQQNDLVFRYEVSYEVVGGLPGIATAFERFTVATSGNPPVSAPLSLAVPQGKIVRLCVSPFADPNPTLPLPKTATCLNSQVP